MDPRKSGFISKVAPVVLAYFDSCCRVEFGAEFHVREPIDRCSNAYAEGGGE
nr:hypothetical protein [Candidatus Freyrarchaeum guaymaensis]